MNQNQITIESLVASEAFQKYCLSPEAEDLKYWENWLNQNQQSHTVFYQAKELVKALTFQLNEDEIRDEYQSLQLKFNLDQLSDVESKETSNTPSKKLKPFRKRTWITRIAAIFLFLVIALFAWQKWNTPSSIEVATTFGETNTFELSDGSQVVLNANSAFRFSEKWNKGEAREVWLQGEAFFDVQHTASQPFIVHTSKGKIEVLGTEFNVQQRSENLEVTLVSGKVQLELSNKTKINLNPNDQVRVIGKTVDHIQVDVKTATDWKDNKMIFKNASIQSVIQRLENNFGWEIKLKNKAILNRKINASIPENNPTLLLEALSEIYDLKIKKEEKGKYVIE